ncbi:MAG: 2Fe-2S iron-sulfur cluster-binding protein, partial [Acidobacteriota bacterium]|nr:2Fe-2S iron-sulfur cluster-binding protein [Acidobacteriota bacterium]
MAENRTFHVWRGDAQQGEFKTYEVEVDPGMVVLDVIHRIQTHQAQDLAVRWNCKAGKCGSCSVEINGKPRLACMTRMNSFGPEQSITVQPLKTFPIVRNCSS